MLAAQQGIMQQNKDIKLNVACGLNPLEGYIGIDKCKESDADIILDVTKEALPYKDNSVDDITTKHTLEHFDFEGTIFVMNEFWRVLKPGHILYAIVPHRKGEGAWTLSHKTYWDERSFTFFTQDRNYKLYGVKLWKIKQVVTNKRPEVHCKMEPIKP